MFSEVTECYKVPPGVATRQSDVRLLAHIVPFLLPRNFVLHPHQHPDIHPDIVDGVAAQISVMPHFLRLAYQLLLYAFNYLAVVRYGRVYTALDPARQQRYLALWSHSPLAPMRDFIKLLRSCALLHYLDHPVLLTQCAMQHHEPENVAYHH